MKKILCILLMSVALSHAGYWTYSQASSAKRHARAAEEVAAQNKNQIELLRDSIHIMHCELIVTKAQTEELIRLNKKLVLQHEEILDYIRLNMRNKPRHKYEYK